MSEREQIKHFADELDNLVDRFRKEYEIAYASMIGTLQLKVHTLCQETPEEDDE